MRKHFLAVLAYVVATFATQAVSHFGVNAAHYAAVTYLRAQPIFALGVLSMLIQGSIMSYLYTQLPQSGRSLGHAVLFAWLVGSIDRKSTRLNSSHGYISYAVFCLKKKKRQY